jgi:hypothetical protein
MRALFIGGTGNISGAVTRASLEKGIELYHLYDAHPEAKAVDPKVDADIDRLMAFWRARVLVEGGRVPGWEAH